MSRPTPTKQHGGQRLPLDGVYFALESSGDYVKIGWSQKPGARLRFLRYAAQKRFGSEDVTYLGIIPGSERRERELHQRFADACIGNEWFRLTPELRAYIDSQRPNFLPVRAFYARKPAGGRPRSDAPRCGCGVMTLKRAEARGKSSEHDPSCEWYRERAVIA